MSRDFAAWARSQANDSEFQSKLENIKREITEKRVQQLKTKVTIGGVTRTASVEVEVYPLKDVKDFLRMLLDFGADKPAERKEVTVNVTTLEELEALPDSELIELASYRGLPELPPAA